MGVKVTLAQGYVEAKVKRLEGAEIILDFPTVTGTENLLMAATLARGRTVIKNAAQEPEVSDLAKFLQAMGARIEGIGTDVLIIEGVKELQPASYRVMSDRIEAGTYLAAAAITRGEVTIRQAPVEHLTAVIDKFIEAGLRLKIDQDVISVKPGGHLTGVDVKTLPYPGFPTDMQAQFMATMTLARGVSVITETIFEKRFMHVSELKRLGADIVVSGNQAVVRGTRSLEGAPVMATDLQGQRLADSGRPGGPGANGGASRLSPGSGLREDRTETFGFGSKNLAGKGLKKFSFATSFSSACIYKPRHSQPLNCSGH